jgi:hypothetical protein
LAKSGQKVKAIALLFSVFGLFFKNETSGRKVDEKLKVDAKSGRKVKAIALLFCCFWPLFQQ